MNKKKLSLILGLIFIIISGYCIYRYYTYKQKISFEEKTLERSDENCEDNCFSVSLNYLYCKGDSEFAKNFNDEIALQLSNFLLSNNDSLQVEGISIERALDSLTKDYYKLHEHFPELPAFEFIATDSIMWQNSKMLSLVSNRYAFTGEAQPTQTKVFTHFALDNGEVITNENLFTDEQKVTQIAKRYFKKAQENATITPLDDKKFDFEDGVFHLPNQMGIAADALILFYEPFEIAPYVDTPFEVKVPIKEIMPYLTFADNK
ncbi:hypothetical protein RCZ04_04850 [Capnocytophaga sp. HP1101]